jgi:hypothetical protein
MVEQLQATPWKRNAESNRKVILLFAVQSFEGETFESTPVKF